MVSVEFYECFSFQFFWMIHNFDGIFSSTLILFFAPATSFTNYLFVFETFLDLIIISLCIHTRVDLATLES